MNTPVSAFTIMARQTEGYQFRIDFDKPAYAPLIVDEPPPLGKDAGPGAGRLLAAALGNCLAASLVFAASKHGIRIEQLRAEVKVEIVRNENRRLRIGRVQVDLDPGLDDEAMTRLRPALEVFEDFCTVTASVRQGLTVEVNVAGA